MKEYYFKNIKQLIHLIQDIGEENGLKFYPTEDSVRLHKTIFFLYYIYLYTYNELPEYPDELVDIEFHALSLGPVYKKLMESMKLNENYLDECMKESYIIDNDLKVAMKSMILELDAIDVYTLLDISRQKPCFKRHRYSFNLIPKEDIISEIFQIKKTRLI